MCVPCAGVPVTAPSHLEHGDAIRRCAWYQCQKPLRADAAPSALTCSQRCRQKRWEMTRHLAATQRAETSLRLAFADPPYVGLSRRYYRDHPDYAGEVDHQELLQRLSTYDGWALAASSDSIPLIGSIVHELCLDARMAVWVRGQRHVRSCWPGDAYEVVWFRPSRLLPLEEPGSNVHAWVARARLGDPHRVIGAKPWPYLGWVFRELLQARPGDQLDDVFPGSGGVTAAWSAFSSNTLSEVAPCSSPS